MRKVGAIGFAAFYLLLTTGMFVCVLHCSGTFLFKDTLNLPANLAHTEDHHAESSCKKKKDCDCCDEHGEYVIKENLVTSKPVIDDLPLVWILADQFNVQFKLSVAETENRILPQNTGPPNDRKTPIYILNQTLLI